MSFGTNEVKGTVMGTATWDDAVFMIEWYVVQVHDVTKDLEKRRQSSI